jgi:hypothetical protein
MVGGKEKKIVTRRREKETFRNGRGASSISCYRGQKEMYVDPHPAPGLASGTFTCHIPMGLSHGSFLGSLSSSCLRE